MTEHGEDPAFYTVVAFGGCGPVHAVDLARRLGIGRVLIPPRAGVASAIGMVVAPVSYDTVRTNRVRVAAADFGSLDTLFAAMASECQERMPDSVDPGSFLRTVGGHAVCRSRIQCGDPVADALLADATADDVRGWFDETYELYGRHTTTRTGVH